MMIPGVDGPKLTRENYQMWIVYEDNDCSQPFMGVFNKLEEGEACETRPCTVPQEGNVFRYVCPEQDIREYSDQVFGLAPYVAFRASYRDNACDFDNVGGALVMRADGVCRRSFIADVVSDNLTTIDAFDHSEMKCDVRYFQLRFTPLDVKNQVCFVTNNNSFMPLYYSGYEDNMVRNPTMRISPADAEKLDNNPTPAVNTKAPSPLLASPSDTSVIPQSTSGDVTPIIVGTVAVVVLCIVVAMLLFWPKKRDQAKNSTVVSPLGTIDTDTAYPSLSAVHHSSLMVTGTSTLATDKKSNCLQLLQSFSSLRIDGAGLRDVRVLGCGAYAIVWLVTDRNGCQYAAKRIIPGRSANIESFLEEIRLNSSLKHPHVVAIKGVAWTGLQDVQVLFEWMVGGDLRSWLRNEKAAKRTTWHRKKMSIAMDILRALHFVHSLDRPIVHRDLKSGNVLLTKDHRAEVILGKANYDKSADIYAFGVLFSEL